MKSFYKVLLPAAYSSRLLTWRIVSYQIIATIIRRVDRPNMHAPGCVGPGVEGAHSPLDLT